MSELVKRLARLPEGRRAEFLAQLRAGAAGGPRPAPEAGAAASASASASAPGAGPTAGTDDGRAREAGPGPVLAPRSGTAPAPLSFAQETLWFLDRLAPGRSTYNTGTAHRLRGALDVPALRRALRALVVRHEVLRTALVEGPDGTVQQVAAVDAPDLADALALPVTDLADPAADGGGDPERAAREHAQELTRRPFDLTRAPLWRAALLRVGKDDHLLVLVVHHIVFDGWSAGVLAEDLSALYAAESRAPLSATAPGARPLPELPALPVQYGDYAVWQRARLTGRTYDDLAAYWRRTLTGAPTLELPADRPRPAEVTYRGSYRRHAIAPAVAEAAARLARAEGVTPYTVHLAAFLLLLRRTTGQDDIVIGTPTAGRDEIDVERLVGFFVNMVALRTDVSGDPDFRAFVRRVGKSSQDAFAHGELPFEKVVQEVAPPRDPSRSPLFQTVFAFHNIAGGGLTLPGLDVTHESPDPGTSRFDLSWNVTAGADGIVVEAEFNTDLYDAETIDALLRQYERVLTVATGDPTLPLTRLPLLTPAERREMIARWNGPHLDVPRLSVPEAFEARVAEAPDATALVVGADTYTYDALNRRANRLAHVLREHGAGPGTRVVLSVERTADLVAGILAVLKTGAAYVPVDPGYPAARMAAITEDAAPAVILAHAGPAVRLPRPEGAALLVLDELDAARAAAPDTDPGVPVAPEDVAYVLYTSGTTGRPKGVLIEHHSVLGFVTAIADLFGLTPEDRVLGYASANFDVSVGEIFNALLTGARLHLVRDAERLDVERLQEVLEEGAVTVADLPPAVMALLEPERLPALRVAFVGGEAFSGELVNRWNQGRRFFNGYGPTECTVTMIVHECPGHWDASPPIGLPIAGHVAHVLDEHLEPLPYGVVGELVIGGEGLTRGYLGAPELTAEKILADPFGTTPDGRLYRTGDLVRRRRDGSLDFVGRADQQVKIRGLRIELGDVEAAVAGCPGIAQAVVVPWTDPHGERHLVAYTVAEPTAGGPGPQEIRAHTAAQLPPYMVPAFFVSLAALPLTPSGKTDHRALPAPEPSAAPAAGPAQEPATETERRIAEEILAPVLRRERVGVHEDFFALGGNSLQAAQLMSRITAEFRVRVALADFFRSPTVAHLAAVVDRLTAEAAGSDLLALIEGMSDEEAQRLLESGDRL
ncbi:amino acid adenylation domain-containing protein [Streptomyces sp. NPDC090022]|uniref:non-ribosomal peptide synthetase n=1 Tax=Streptomyces sp. NPDC090022 TaxID=3365920 RepID=UPI0038235F0B